MDYVKAAKEILTGVGGYENILKISHCLTRLRFQLIDESKCKDNLIKSIPGVFGIVKRGLQYQVILGPEAGNVYHQLKINNNDGNHQDNTQTKENILERESTFERKSIQEKGSTEDMNSKIHIKVYAPISGKLIPINEVNDPTFACEVLGKGVAILPEDGMVYAPFDGTVITIFSTLHALCLLSDQGVEMLIHIGINTVRLNGTYFTAHIKSGDKIKKGQLILEYDLEIIKKIGYDTIIPIVITNSDNYQEIIYTIDQNVRKGDNIIELYS